MYMENLNQHILQYKQPEKTWQIPQMSNAKNNTNGIWYESVTIKPEQQTIYNSKEDTWNNQPIKNRDSKFWQRTEFILCQQLKGENVSGYKDESF